MSQEYNDTSRKSRRAARAQRNRPMLVTTQEVDSEQSEQSAPSTDDLVVEQPQAAEEAAPAPKTRRRLPGFFSTVGKSEEQGEKEVDVAQARLARATRGKVTSKAASQTTPAEETKPTRPAASKASSTPQRPASAFKTRYIIGMGIYLLSANFIGLYETQFLRSINADQVLSQFNLFGGTVIIRTSTLLFLATLIIILVLLARFDLIPRNLGAMSGAAPNRSGQSSNRSSSDSGEGARNIPPPMKQGVKGADDKLYQAYRANQRREKKK
ncbi:MAG: hypothetical protein JOZ18_16710 [Chloroflexi bacterium]|nr:hypothetical protein [Chloroflexota bacterium]